MRFTDLYQILTEDKLTDELERSSLTQEQKDQVREVNSLLFNKIKYIQWLIKNVDALPDDIVVLLNWFQSRNDLEDKDIAHYTIADLQTLYNEKSGTKSRERKAVQAVTDEEGVDRIYQKGPITVWKVKQPKWLRKNFANTNWCVASSDYMEHYNTYTIGEKLTFYVIHDDSKKRYKQSDTSGDRTSDLCIGVAPEGNTIKDARQYADNTDMGESGVYKNLEKLGIDPVKLGLPPQPSDEEWLAKAVIMAGYVVIEKGERVLKGDLILNDIPVKSLLKLGIDRVTGIFSCPKTLTSLEGAPTNVKGSFDCSDCTGLKSLQYSPTSVEGSFDCSGCTSLTSLQYAPTSVMNFSCFGCTGLESLQYVPKSMKWDFSCSGCTGLTSLQYAPTSVGVGFDCSKCISLTSLQYVPTSVKKFSCSGCTSLTSLQYAPTSVGRRFDCSRCTGITSLQYAPTSVEGSFYCDGCGRRFTEEDVRAVCKVGMEIRVEDQ